MIYDRNPTIIPSVLSQLHHQDKPVLLNITYLNLMVKMKAVLKILLHFSSDKVVSEYQTVIMNIE